MHTAAIDIGTVTTRLLIADVSCSQEAAFKGRTSEAQKQIREVCREINITHLGRHLGWGASEDKLLSTEGMTAVLDVLKEYVQIIKQYQVKSVRCVATSAVRDAENSKELIDAARALGINIEVISGEEEAQLAFMGACYETASPATLLIDPGGGSTEFVLGSAGDAGRGSGSAVEGGRVEIQELESLQVGSRRLTDLFIKSDPPSKDELEDIRKHVRELFLHKLERYRDRFEQIVAVAGTATTLAAALGKVDPYDPNKIQGTVVRRDDLDTLLYLFVSKTLEERKQIVGLEPKRADVIVAGTLILEAALDVLDCRQFKVSDRDILYGIVLSATICKSSQGPYIRNADPTV